MWDKSNRRISDSTRARTTIVAVAHLAGCSFCSPHGYGNREIVCEIREFVDNKNVRYVSPVPSNFEMHNENRGRHFIWIECSPITPVQRTVLNQRRKINCPIVTIYAEMLFACVWVEQMCRALIVQLVHVHRMILNFNRAYFYLDMHAHKSNPFGWSAKAAGSCGNCTSIY